jgi:hypothetical protein
LKKSDDIRKLKFEVHSLGRSSCTYKVEGSSLRLLHSQAENSEVLNRNEEDRHYVEKPAKQELIQQNEPLTHATFGACLRNSETVHH